ncbi:hypothetical protein LINPERPRIM_LOCUS24080 [Linum perenne]
MRTEDNMQIIGSLFNQVKRIESSSLQDDEWTSFLRVRMELKIDQPLPTGFRCNVDGKIERIEFVYERIPDFCYCCGKMGHTISTCDIRKANPAAYDPQRSKYSAAMRAETRRSYGRYVLTNRPSPSVTQPLIASHLLNTHTSTFPQFPATPNHSHSSPATSTLPNNHHDSSAIPLSIDIDAAKFQLCQISNLTNTDISNLTTHDLLHTIKDHHSSRPTLTKTCTTNDPHPYLKSAITPNTPITPLTTLNDTESGSPLDKKRKDVDDLNATNGKRAKDTNTTLEWEGSGAMILDVPYHSGCDTAMDTTKKGSFKRMDGV